MHLLRRLLMLSVVGLVALVALPAAAAAHLEIEADGDVSETGIVSVTLTVEEECSGGTKKIELFYPAKPELDTATPGVVPGWTASVEKDPASGAVSKVTWEGEPTASAKSFDLPLTLGQIPDAIKSIEFKATQTCPSGEVIRWIQATPAGGPEPDNPAPVLAVTARTPGPTTTSRAASNAETSNNSDFTGPIAIMVGAAAVIFGGAYLLTRRKNRTSGGT